MLFTVTVCVLTCLLMIASILFFPRISVRGKKVDSYWVVVLAGAAVLLLSGHASPTAVGAALTANTAINPLKILVLFLSMTVLSVFLDENGFFRYLAAKTLGRAGGSQKRLFFYLYLIVSVLTVFTSNDVIILSFTPFICYFAKNARISPLPYLAAEFIGANTWSMALIIGNPTNIYLATAYGVDFAAYLRVMLLPTLLAGTVAYLLLRLLFRRHLSAPIAGCAEEVRITDKTALSVGLVHLCVCTVALAVGSYIGLEMWLVAIASVISLFVCVAFIGLLRRCPPRVLWDCLCRAPFQLVPFVLSMFVMILALAEAGVTESFSALLGDSCAVAKYGALSFLFSNLINNIPMSVLFSSVLEPLEGIVETKAMFASVIGSNIGAFLTPIGALAGLMWTSILGEHGIRFGYRDFLKIGAVTAIPTLAVALLALGAEFLFLF